MVRDFTWMSTMCIEVRIRLSQSVRNGLSRSWKTVGLLAVWHNLRLKCVILPTFVGSIPSRVYESIFETSSVYIIIHDHSVYWSSAVNSSSFLIIKMSADGFTSSVDEQSNIILVEKVVYCDQRRFHFILS